MVKKKVIIKKTGLERLTSYEGLSEQQKEYVTKRRLKVAEAKSRKIIQEEKIKSAMERVTGGKISAPIRKADAKFSAGVRKLIHVLAPKGGMVKAITTPSKKGSGRGRGRPAGTFKTRMLPSGKIVKVHTNVYKKLLAQEKAQMDNFKHSKLQNK